MKKMLTLAAVICFAAAAFALPPENTIAYSGFLRDFDGNIVGVPNGAVVTMTFRLHLVETPGTLGDATGFVWEEEHSSVVVDNGEFTVYLGETVPFDTDNFTITYGASPTVTAGSDGLPDVDFHSDNQYWLGVSVDPATVTDRELSPRKKITVVPYAFDAADVIESRAADPPNPYLGQIWLIVP